MFLPITASILVINISLTVLNLFSIGGTPQFICEALNSELAARAAQDTESLYPQSWHVVVLPDSNMSSAPRFNHYRHSLASQRYPVATDLRPNQQNPLNTQMPMFPQMPILPQTNAANIQQPIIQQPMFPQNNFMSGHGQASLSVAPSLQSQFTTPMPGTFSSGSVSMMMAPKTEFHSLNTQQGSFQGFPPNSGPAQSNNNGQRLNPMLNQSSGALMEPLPQVRRPIFDEHGFIVGEESNMNDNNMYSNGMYGNNMSDNNMYGNNVYGNNMYGNNMYGNNMVGPYQPMPLRGAQQQSNPPQRAQNAEASDPQLAADAHSFFSFVRDNMNQGEGNQSESDQEKASGDEASGDESSGDEASGDEASEDDVSEDDVSEDKDNEVEAGQEERAQDEGVALGSTSTNHGSPSNSQQATPRQPAAASSQPENPHGESLLASQREPHRFADNTGMGLCDYCGREGHEAVACIKWDPVHLDKPVCTACNNDQHLLDECPKFGAMPPQERAALLFVKGARRPGVRSENHAWTSYVRPGDDYNENDGGSGVPITRVYMHVMLTLHREALQDIWKVWDYGRGVPDEFRDRRAEFLAGSPEDPLDERFMGGEHQLHFIHAAPENMEAAAAAGMRAVEAAEAAAENQQSAPAPAAAAGRGRRQRRRRGGR